LERTLKKRIAEGYSPLIKIIPAETREDAIEMEILLISLIGRDDLGTGSLFNFTNGGEGTAGIKRTHSEATKLKMSYSHITHFQKPGAREKVRDSQVARFQRPENREVLSGKMKDRAAAGLHKGGRRPQPCTVDGITIYPSRKSLIDALGQGCLGVKNPDFRYTK